MSPHPTQLTDAQKDLLLDLSATEPREAYDAAHARSRYGIAVQLAARGLIIRPRRGTPGWILTDLGKRIRTMLEAEALR